MKAIRITAPMKVNELYVMDLPDPEPGPGQVRVRICSAALNYRELLILKGMWPQWGTFILGSDGTGVVDALGEGVEDVELGQEVLINPGLGWGKDQRAPNPSFNVLGGPVDGCFAEAVVVPAENVNLRPPHLSWDEAAAIPIASLTAFRGLVIRANLTSDDTLLIHGIGGGVAQAGLIIAKALGANTIVTSSSDDKLTKARDMGADYTINYRTQYWADVAMELTRGFGPDLILDSVGGETLQKSIEVVRIGGRIVSLGMTTGPIQNFSSRSFYNRHLDLIGSALGSPTDFKTMLEFYTIHNLRPFIDSVWQLNDIAQALESLEVGRQFGKIVLHISSCEN